MRCMYSVLRFVPDPARGEFVNVGVIVGSEDSGRCQVRLLSSRRRASLLAPSGSVNTFWDYLQDFKHRSERQLQQGGLRYSDEWLAMVASESSNLLQFSEPAPMRTSRLSEAVQALAEQLLVDEPARRARRGPTRATIQARIREVYQDLGLEKGREWIEKPLVSGPNHEEEFDFVLRNGQAVQLTQAWNFAVRDVHGLTEGVKAWGWTVQDIREEGGYGRAGRREFEVPRDVDVEAVFIHPANEAGRNALNEAKHVFDEVGALAVPMEAAADLGERAMDLLEH